MSGNDFMNALGYMWQEANSRIALMDLLRSNFSQGYQTKEVQDLIFGAVLSTMTPEYFTALLIGSMGENNPYLSLGNETIAEIAKECIWNEIRRRNLELTVLTVFQQGLVSAQKNCKF